MIVCNEETLRKVVVPVKVVQNFLSHILQSMQFVSCGSWLYNEFSTWTGGTVTLPALQVFKIVGDVLSVLLLLVSKLFPISIQNR